MEGLVIKSTGSSYTVRFDDGLTRDTGIKGRIRLEELKTTNPVAVGDRVQVEIDTDTGSHVISEILPRKNYISRQSPKHKYARHIVAANLDMALVIATVAQPRTSTGFIDRFLLTAEAFHIPAMVVFNKQDVLRDKELRKQLEIREIYDKIGYPTLEVSAITGEGVEALQDALKDKITLMAGHSGVGKSTLINALNPELQIKTAEISKKYKKGTHTTTFAQMHDLPFGGSIIDTPGIKEFGILDLEPREVSHFFPEMRALLQECKFNNCLHEEEPGCAVREAVESGEIDFERYKNYINILYDSKAHKPYE